MAAFNGYRVKDRTAKVNKRRNAMPVNGRSVMVIQSVIVAQAEEARRNQEHLRAQHAKGRKGA